MSANYLGWVVNLLNPPKGLSNLGKWTAKQQMWFNNNKCKEMRVRAKNPSFTYTLMRSELSITTLTKRAAAVKVANSLLAAIMELIVSKTINIIKPFSKVDLLEIPHRLQLPYLKKDNVKLEKVTRRATKMIRDLEHLLDIVEAYLEVSTMRLNSVHGV